MCSDGLFCLHFDGDVWLLVRLDENEILRFRGFVLSAAERRLESGGELPKSMERTLIGCATAVEAEFCCGIR